MGTIHLSFIRWYLDPPLIFPRPIRISSGKKTSRAGKFLRKYGERREEDHQNSITWQEAYPFHDTGRGTGKKPHTRPVFHI
jgi:hypothetical protein